MVLIFRGFGGGGECGEGTLYLLVHELSQASPGDSVTALEVWKRGGLGDDCHPQPPCGEKASRPQCSWGDGLQHQ